MNQISQSNYISFILFIKFSLISNSIISRLEKEYLEKEEDLKDQISSLTNKLRLLKTENIIKENKIINLQSELERLQNEFANFKLKNQSEHKNTENEQSPIPNQQEQINHKEHSQIENISFEGAQDTEMFPKENSLNKFKEDLSSFNFDKNLEFSDERFKILAQQTEILLTLNKQLDKDSLVYEDEKEHLTIEQFKKQFPDQSTIEILQNSNIKLQSYNQNISTIVEQTKKIIKVLFLNLQKKDSSGLDIEEKKFINNIKELKRSLSNLNHIGSPSPHKNDIKPDISNDHQKNTENFDIDKNSHDSSKFFNKTQNNIGK